MCMRALVRQPHTPKSADEGLHIRSPLTLVQLQALECAHTKCSLQLLTEMLVAASWSAIGN